MAVEGDLLLLVLLAVEIRTLLRCFRVCKSWRELIRSGWFRKAWSERHLDEQSLVLLSLANDSYAGDRLGVRCWLPPRSSASQARGRISPYLQLGVPGAEHSQFDIVASSKGLVCACLDTTEAKCRYVVGNPLTGEWVHLRKLPRVHHLLKDDLYTEYSLRVSAGGDFKLQVLDKGANHVFVYTSTTRCWRNLSKACVEVPDVVMHDVDEGWMSIKPPIKLNGDDARESIWQPAQWSYKGQTYLAGCFVVSAGVSLEHIIWKASSLEKKPVEKKPEEAASGVERVPYLVWDTGVEEKQVVREEIVGRHTADMTLLAYHGEGKLCAAATYVSDGPVPPAVYDVSSNVWYHLREFSWKGRDSTSTFCTRAVVYHRSIIKPDQGGSGTRVRKRKRHAELGVRLTHGAPDVDVIPVEGPRGTGVRNLQVKEILCEKREERGSCR